MDFRILGPLEATGDRGHVPLTGGKQKALLAVLLLHADHVVSAERLVEDLWGEDFPGTAHKMVQIFVSQLRKQLPEGLLRTRAPGYVLDLDGHSLDQRRFDEIVAEGREALARGGAEQAARHFQNALALWRGPALAEFEEPFAGLESARLEEQRLACLEDRIEADLALGRHGELVGELYALVRRHRYRERLRGQLMLALYRSGRHAEALASYQGFRRMLSEELGIDPSARLRELERRMLQQDASLEFPGPDAARAGTVPERDHTGAHFTATPPGRERELTYLTRLSEEAFGGGRRLVFVTGDPGIGKTTIIESFVSRIRGGGRAAVAVGQCVEHRGAGEPYLPVLEALGRLFRQERGEQLVQLLARYAPTWLSQMPWLVPDDELEAIRGRIVGATRARMLRELLEALDAIADALPLALVLED
ncbi:MAG TPA: BTAD domain-containing putative transcriptional regulator, partial [Solirubrobacteraceae bacterium]|nr:BTAD domain-containing putative transcriptional regulator [Solirubrobacteraceae bacterium]